MVQMAGLSFRAVYFTATALNLVIILIVAWAALAIRQAQDKAVKGSVRVEVVVVWKDIAPRKNFAFREANPLAALPVLSVSRAMVGASRVVFNSGGRFRRQPLKDATRQGHLLHPGFSELLLAEHLCELIEFLLRRAS